MKKLRILLCGVSTAENAGCIKDEIHETEIIRCHGNALDIQKFCLTEHPDAVILGSDSCFPELIEHISSTEFAPRIYIIRSSFTAKTLSAEIPNVCFVDEKTTLNELIGRIKLDSIEFFKEGVISKETVCEHIKTLIRMAMSDLGISAKYTGFMYIVRVLEAICTAELRRSDSMCKIIYPHIAREFGVSSAVVERNIRTAIKSCWKNSDNLTRAKYFGMSFNSRSAPTNREFVMVLADTLITYTEKYKLNLRIKNIREIM